MWYIISMHGLRNKRVQGTLALFTATVFFAGQAFACCMATRDLASLLASVFKSAPAASAHACCPKPEAASSGASGSSGKPDCASNGCCIQDAGHRAPQLASAPAEVPELSGPVIAHLDPFIAFVLPAPAPARMAADTGPPSWLRTVRILV
jgi:hypothetical protein